VHGFAEQIGGAVAVVALDPDGAAGRVVDLIGSERRKGLQRRSKRHGQDNDQVEYSKSICEPFTSFHLSS